MKIGNVEVGEGNRCFIVAELSANHNNDFELAKKTIKAAKEAGADAVKLQTYTADTITLDVNNEYFQTQKGSLWEEMTLHDLYKQAYTPWEWQPELKKYAQSLGMECFSSPFDKTAVDFLEKMDVPAYKVASFEITDIPLIRYIASKGKPVIISTGVATMFDIEEAIKACKDEGNNQIIMLKCTSAYPAKLEDANLKTIENMKETFNVETGLSDHTLGITVPILSVAFGAKMIEKHFILDKSIKTLDSDFSLDKDEFSQMVKSVREAEKAMGKVTYELTGARKSSKEYARSLFVAENIKKGELLTENNIRSVRPGNGMHPRYYNEVLGKKVRTDVEKGTPLTWELIEK